MNQSNVAAYQDFVIRYHKAENVMERARIIKTIREYHKTPFHQLSEDLYEVERQVYRYNELNKLIPEFQELLENGEIRMVKARVIAKKSEKEQQQLFRLAMRKKRIDEGQTRMMKILEEFIQKPNN